MRLRKAVPAYLVWIGLLLSGLPARAQQAMGSGAESNSTAPPITGQQRATLDDLPDSPGATRSKLLETEDLGSNLKAQSVQPVPVAPQTADLPTQPQSQLLSPPPQKPVGTAAAGPMKVSGVAAFQPTGVAIAPAKQRRARTIALRVGAIIGAGVAVGTVVALTFATSSKPPGAR